MKVFNSRYDWQDWCASICGDEIPAEPEPPHIVYHNDTMLAAGLFHGKTWRGAIQSFARVFKTCAPIQKCWQYAIREELCLREEVRGHLFRRKWDAERHSNAWSGNSFDWCVERRSEDAFYITLFLRGGLCTIWKRVQEAGREA